MRALRCRLAPLDVRRGRPLFDRPGKEHRGDDAGCAVTGSRDLTRSDAGVKIAEVPDPTDSYISACAHSRRILPLPQASSTRAAAWRRGRSDACPRLQARRRASAVPSAAGIVESQDTAGRSWLPYVEVADIDSATARASELGASVCSGARGPSGLAQHDRDAGRRELALSRQPKDRADGAEADGMNEAEEAARSRHTTEVRTLRPIDQPRHRASAAERTLLPVARLRPRRRGRAAGSDARRAWRGLARFRRAQLAAVVGCTRSPRTPAYGDRAAAQARPADRVRAGDRRSTPAPAPGPRDGMDRDPTRTRARAFTDELGLPEAAL